MQLHTRLRTHLRTHLRAQLELRPDGGVGQEIQVVAAAVVAAIAVVATITVVAAVAAVETTGHPSQFAKRLAGYPKVLGSNPTLSTTHNHAQSAAQLAV